MRAVTKAKLTPDEVCAILGNTAKEHFKSVLSNKEVSDSHKRYKLLFPKFYEYHSKCCYCESQLTGTEVEHFRPKAKDKYWWLVYSWDNVMPICSACNRKKHDKFPILGKKITKPSSNIKELYQAQGRILAYNRIEQPVFINPECDIIPEDAFIFKKDGTMESANLGDRFQETINEIGLDRRQLRLNRMKLIDDFENKIASIQADSQIKDKQQAFFLLAKLFLNDSKDETQTYTAFRKYAVKHLLTNYINKSLNP